MKHLVIDARAALPQTDGLGTYLRQIVPFVCAAGAREKSFRSTLLVSPDVEAFWRDAVPSASVLPSAIRPMKVAQNWQVPRLLRALRPDLYFYPAHDPPLFLRVPFVFTIHDVTLFRLRPYFERLDRTKRGYLKVVTPTALRRARAVFAVSATTKQEIGTIFGRRLLPKIHVTPNGIRARDALRATTRGECDRLLYVGTDRPHKNLARVVEAYGVARRELPNLPRLEIVGGMRTPDELARRIREAGVVDHVVMRGHVSDAELEDCYAHAVALVFPSVAEGFGLPILEAMVRSVPVLTSNISACAEVAQDAALTVDPLSVEAIARGIVRICGDAALRERLVEKGHARAAVYTWERTSAGTLDVLRRCIYPES